MKDKKCPSAQPGHENESGESVKDEMHAEEDTQLTPEYSQKYSADTLEPGQLTIT